MECGDCGKTPFICLAERKGFVLLEEVKALEEQVRFFGCPFMKENSNNTS